MQSDDVDEFMSNMPVTYDFEISNISASAPAATDDKTKGKGGKTDKDAGGKGGKNSGKSTGKAANLPPDNKLLSDKPIN